MATDVFPYSPWLSGTNQNSIPANDNALRAQVVGAAAISIESTQPGSPSDDDVYILGTAPSGAQWSSFAEDDVVIFNSGTWYSFAPFDGWLKFNADDGETYRYAAGWSIFSSGGGGGGSTQGKQAIPIMAASMRPSISVGCSPFGTIASAANQPDIGTIDFDPTTQEYAQFAIPMPKKWNAGTITAQFRWSHASTTTNFGVVWSLQAVGVGDDDTIAVNYGTAQTVTDTGGTTNDLYISGETSAITVGGSPAKSDTVYFRVARVAADGSDTLAIDARLHSVVVFVTTDADTDA